MFRLQKKNQNYFPQGCELERIKPNLGTLSALSAPHDKINFCSQHISAGGDAGSVVPATPHVPGHGLCWRGGGVPSTHPAGSSAGVPQVGRCMRASAQPKGDFPQRHQVASTSHLSRRDFSSSLLPRGSCGRDFSQVLKKRFLCHPCWWVGPETAGHWAGSAETGEPGPPAPALGPQADTEAPIPTPVPQPLVHAARPQQARNCP